MSSESINALSLVGMIGMVGAWFATILFFSALVSVRREERDKALLERDKLRDELSRAKSSGADLAPKVGWRKQRFMNKPEFVLFLELERIVAQGRAGHRLFAQVSFGAFLEATSRADLTQIRDAAFYSVQRKVADFLLIDKFGNPVAVIEYQGDGHYQGNAHDRDHAKRVACQRAGIPYIEVPATGLTKGQRHDLRLLLGIAPQMAAE
jgi:hypothetical protein